MTSRPVGKCERCGTQCPTERQKAVLEAARILIERHGYAPTEREIGDALGMSGTAIRKHLALLEKKGLVTRSVSKARSLRLHG